MNLAGNSDVTRLKLKNQLEAQILFVETYTLLDFDFAESDGEKNQERYEGIFRWQYLPEFANRLNLPVKRYSQVAWIRDLFNGVDNQISFTSGLNGMILKTNSQNLAILSGLEYRYEKQETGAERQSPRIEATSKYEIFISSKVKVMQTNLIDSNFQDFSAYEFTGVSAIEFKLTQRVVLKYEYTLFYRNKPIKGFSDTDNRYNLLIVLNWRE